MGNYEQLKQAVADVIKTNGNQEITGAILQNSLLTIISTVGANATFAGIATPETNPGTPDQNVFYIASENGTYSNFGGVTLTDEVAIFVNTNGTWVKKDTGIVTDGKINNLNKNVGIDEYEVFSDVKEYPAGRTVLKDGFLYTFKVEHTAGNWDPNEVEMSSLNKIFGKNDDLLNINLNTYKKAVFGENLFNKNAAYIGGKYINNISENGDVNLFTSVFYAVSDYIPVEPNKRYFGVNVAEGRAYSAFFDKNLKAISLFRTSDGKNIISPGNAVWCRLSFVKANIDSIQFGQRESEFTEYNEFTDSLDLENVRRNNNTRFSVDLWSLIDNSFIATNGNIASNKEFKVSDFVRFDRKYGITFKLQTSCNQYVLCLALYDESKKYIQGYNNIDSDGAIKEHHIKSNDIPKNACYFRCTIYTTTSGLAPSNISYKEYENYVIFKENTEISETQNTLTDVNKVVKYYNAFNKDDIDYKENYFIDENGNEVTNNYSSAYAVTGFIKLPNYCECVSINYQVGNVYAAFYNENK